MMYGICLLTVSGALHRSCDRQPLLDQYDHILCRGGAWSSDEQDNRTAELPHRGWTSEPEGTELLLNTPFDYVCCHCSVPDILRHASQSTSKQMRSSAKVLNKRVLGRPSSTKYLYMLRYFILNCLHRRSQRTGTST